MGFKSLNGLIEFDSPFDRKSMKVKEYGLGGPIKGCIASRSKYDVLESIEETLK